MARCFIVIQFVLWTVPRGSSVVLIHALLSDFDGAKLKVYFHSCKLFIKKINLALKYEANSPL